MNAYKNLKELIDKNKRQLEALRESEEKHRALVETTDTGFFIINESGIILDANNEFARLTGHKTREEIIGKSVLEWTAASSRHHHEKAIAQCLMSGSTRDLLIDYVSSTDEIIPIEINATVVETEQGKQILSLCRDITDRRRTQEIMIQTEKMMSVGGLAAGMAHEINNPLAGMIQNASVIKSRLKSIDLPANLKTAKELGLSMADISAFLEKRNVFRMIDAILEAGAHAAEIINGMLGFARKSDANITSHYPDQLMDKILELASTEYDLKKQYDFKSIKIIKKYADNLPLLPCEDAKIQQVLLNILRNGAQAMHTAKTESPRFLIRIYNEKEPEMVHIEIEDNGPGMDEKTRLKVFDPFFTTKPVGVGTGLGLSVSFFIITENHKGTMDVISQPGKGANFIIRLPVDRKK